MAVPDVLGKLALCASVLLPLLTLFGEDRPKTAPPIDSAATVPGQRTISFRLYERAPDGTTVKMLARPSIMTLTGRPFGVLTGGEIKRAGSADVLEFGTRLDGRIGEAKEGLFPVTVKLSVGQPVQVDDPNVKAVQSKSVGLLLDMALSETKTVQVGDGIWCDIMLE